MNNNAPQLIQEVFSHASKEQTFPLVDAHDGEARTLSIRPDQHGLCIRIDGSEQVLFLDLAAGELRVFIAESDEADIDDPVGILVRE